jgi:hypothetical protein
MTRAPAREKEASRDRDLPERAPRAQLDRVNAGA